MRPREAAFAEVLTRSMPDIRIDGGTLAMHWGATLVAMNVEAELSLQITLAESEAQPYLGRYDYMEKDSSSVA